MQTTTILIKHQLVPQLHGEAGVYVIQSWPGHTGRTSEQGAAQGRVLLPSQQWFIQCQIEQSCASPALTQLNRRLFASAREWRCFDLKF